MVFEPVDVVTDPPVDAVVPASISLLLKRYFGVTEAMLPAALAGARTARPGAALRSSGLDGLRRLRGAHARHEQRLVDPPLEDRDPQLHALGDDLATLEIGLACELGGG